MKIKLTETQLNKVIKSLVTEQGLYGDTSDVVDYDLPEFLSDTILISFGKDSKEHEHHEEDLVRENY